MAQVIGFTPEDWPEARDAINAVRRGGLEHPFHRRQSPVNGGEVFLFRIDTNETSFGGSRNSGGVLHEVTGWPVISADGSFDFTTDSGSAVEINAKHFDGLLVPGRYYNCIQQFGKWVPADHGQSQFSRCQAMDAITHDTPGTIRVYLRNSGTPEYIEVEAIVPTCADLVFGGDPIASGEPVVEGSCCTAFWDAERQVMVVTWAACPPVED